MRYTVLLAGPAGDMRLERDVTFGRERAMRDAGFVVLETWMHAPSLGTVLRTMAEWLPAL